MNNIIGTLMGLGLIYMFVMIICYIVYVIGLFKMFHKMGEPGWKAIIPFVNTYTLTDRTWDAKFFWISMLLMVVTNFLSGFTDNSLLMLLARVAALAMFVLKICGNYKQSQAFGCGIGMTLILIFFPMIGTLLLGYGNYSYIGPQEKGRFI